jgi:hypothetical protein
MEKFSEFIEKLEIQIKDFQKDWKKKSRLRNYTFDLSTREVTTCTIKSTTQKDLTRKTMN